jgi:hypothetical protein
MNTQTDTRNLAAIALGRLGGKSKSAAKIAAARVSVQKAHAQRRINAELARLLKEKGLAKGI